MLISRLAFPMAVGLAAWLGRPGHASSAAPSAAPTIARGTFDVKITPDPFTDQGEKAALGRMAIAKEYHGDLVGTGTGEMLTAGSVESKSGAYVAIELVHGTLQGKRGSFALQHSGTMTRGSTQLAIAIVPDSGTEELLGITGSVDIVIADGKHSYELRYELVRSP